MISDEYKEQLRQTREGWEGWGSSAGRNGALALTQALEKRTQIVSVLDFGCGTGVMGEVVRLHQANGLLRKDVVIHDYDPSVPGKDVIPTGQFDMIMSCDVMEHIEPESLDETLAWQRDHCKYTMFHHIDCNETRDRLPDGRDVHLIVQPPEWWQAKYASPQWNLQQRTILEKYKAGRLLPRTSVTLILDRRGQ